MLRTVLALVALSASLGVHAQSSGKGLKPATANADAYVEASLNSVNYTQTGLRLSPTALRVILGKNMGPTFSYEGLIALGTSDGERTVGVDKAYARIDPILGAYVKARKELAPGMDIFARVGAASMVKKLSGPYYGAEPINERMGSLSYGLGIKIAVRRDISFVTDYMSYYNRKQETVDGFSLGMAIDY